MCIRDRHYHVRNGKAVSLKIFWVVDIEAGINIFKGSFRRKGRGIDKLIAVSYTHLDVYKRQLQAQKEALYADYGKLKKKVREYDIIKQNIDSILQADRQPEREKGTERG